MGLVDTNEAVEHFRRVIEATENNGAYNEGFIDALEFCISHLSTMPSARSELEDKIRSIGYTGKEGRIYIGGRLFAVRELPQ